MILKITVVSIVFILLNIPIVVSNYDDYDKSGQYILISYDSWKENCNLKQYWEHAEYSHLWWANHSEIITISRNTPEVDRAWAKVYRHALDIQIEMGCP